jgi:hypothetical protein
VNVEGILTPEREAETREAIRANRTLLAGALAVVWSVKALKILEGRLARAGLEREPFQEIECQHRWCTQDEPLGAVYCLACGAPEGDRMSNARPEVKL